MVLMRMEDYAAPTYDVDSSLKRMHTYDDSMVSAAPKLIQLKDVCV